MATPGQLTRCKPEYAVLADPTPGRARLTTVRETEIGVGAERAERSETPEPADCRLSRIMDASLR